jgi:hypothetical protein
MEDVCTYQIRIRGEVDVNDLNALSPTALTALETAKTPACTGVYTCTIVQVCTDQSGMIGLLRHLHGLGLFFISVECLNEKSA